jgi:predicted Fe-Mo cluster-binding NifX family protein
MQIAAAIDENSPNAHIAENFGRAGWFAVYNTEQGEVVPVENPFRLLEEQAGRRTAGMLVEEYKITVVVAGRFGSKVVEYFKNNNVQMVICDHVRTLGDIMILTKNKK